MVVYFFILSQLAGLIKLAMGAGLCYAVRSFGMKGGAAMHEDRALLRRLLGALLAERPDSAGLYVPRGEDGMIRMIRALLDMRPPREHDPLAGEIEAFRRMH